MTGKCHAQYYAPKYFSVKCSACSHNNHGKYSECQEKKIYIWLRLKQYKYFWCKTG